MFEALLNGRVDTEGLEFDLSMADIEELNRAAIAQAADVSKISCAIIPQLAGKYKILDSGAALGRGNGPLLVSRHKIYPDEIAHASIALPGEHTTANMLMNRLFPEATRKGYYLFSDIVDVVFSGERDAGVLIHEGRFTYKNKGLKLVADLGVEWERRTEMSLPLGVIAVRAGLPEEVQHKCERVLRRSVEYAMANPGASEKFVRAHAQEMDIEVMRQHIALFVNEYSISLGSIGREAVCALTGCEADKIFV